MTWTGEVREVGQGVLDFERNWQKTVEDRQSPPLPERHRRAHGDHGEPLLFMECLWTIVVTRLTTLQYLRN